MFKLNNILYIMYILYLVHQMNRSFETSVYNTMCPIFTGCIAAMCVHELQVTYLKKSVAKTSGDILANCFVESINFRMATSSSDWRVLWLFSSQPVHLTYTIDKLDSWAATCSLTHAYNNALTLSKRWTGVFDAGPAFRQRWPSSSVS